MTVGGGMAGAARCLEKWNGCLAIIAVSAWSVGAWGVGAAAQSQGPRTAGKAPATASGTRWTSPRTPWGDPDLQGLWPSLDMQGTPYERPPNLAGRTALSDEELAARQAQRRSQDEADAKLYIDPGQRRGSGTGPPSHWGEHGTPARQTSLVVEPADGRIPPMTAEGRTRVAMARSTYYYDFPDEVVAHAFDNFEDLGPYDRCITRGVLASMLPTGYNMGTEIFQIPGYVVIRNEMIHETPSCAKTRPERPTRPHGNRT